MTQVTGIELVVEGRTFIQEPPTFEQEMYILQQVVESGFDQPIENLGLDPKTMNITSATKRLIVHAYKSGVLFDLLGALVTENGQEWTPERAKEIGRLFKQTRDEEAKRQLHPALVAAISAFFVSASSSETTSPISSDIDGVSVRPNESRRKLTETQADQVFRSGNTALLSERSPSTKRSVSKRPSAGKSERD